MYISDLKEGQKVSIELERGSQVYEISTTVVGTSQDRALLRLFEFRGQVLDLGRRGKDGIIFNLYAEDGNGHRVRFANVAIRIVEFEYERYYAVTAKGFRAVGEVSERRNNKRTPVSRDAIMACPERLSDAEKVRVYDISNEGISFVAERPLGIKGAKLVVEFSDKVNNVEFDLKINCKCIREMASKNGVMYGCSISEAERNMISYVYMSRLMQK